MKKLLAIALFSMILFSVNALAYTESGGVFYCENCTDCTNAINNNTLNTVYLNASISTTTTCINNPINFTNKIFDCQDYTISISGPAMTGSAIYTTGKSNNIINNCIISGFQYGIRLESSSNYNIISNNTIESNMYGIRIVSSTINTIVNNTITDSSDGITLSGSSNEIVNNTIYLNDYGIRFGSVQNNTIINNTINSNSEYGINIGSASGNSIIDNTIQENGEYDVYVNTVTACINQIENNTGTGGNLIKFYNSTVNLQNDIISYLILCNADNSIVNNLTMTNTTLTKNNALYILATDNAIVSNITSSGHVYGIQLKDSTNNTFTNNTVTTNSQNGIFVLTSNNNTFINNTASSNDEYGFHIRGSSNNTFRDNVANSNRHGFTISLLPGLMAGSILNVSESNDLVNNTINLNNYGIWIGQNSSYNTFVDNNIASSSRNGITIDGASYNELVSNTIHSSGAVGIDMRYSTQNNLTNNIMTSNRYGLLLYGDTTFLYGSNSVEFYNHYLDNNIIDGKLAYYYRDQENVEIIPTNPGWVGCWNCSNVTFRDFTISGSGNGILFAGTSDSNLTNLTIGSNYVGFTFSPGSDNNTVSKSFIYDNLYRTVMDFGVNNIFLSDNIYLYDMVVPAANTWYTSFNDMSFKISNLTYANMSCSQYIDSILTRTNTSVKADQKTNFAYTIPEGSHSYYFTCTDTNYSQTFNIETSSVNFGIKMSLDSVCTADTQCLSGYCTAGVCSNSRTSSSYVQTSGGLPAASTTTIPLTIGPVFVPSGGLVMVIDNDTTLDLYGTKAYINDIYVIDPNNLSPISCNQTALSSYEIDVDIDDKAYVCFDKADYSDLQSITVYTIKENEWKELDEIVIRDDKICGRITSSPYMIAGFSIPATADKALESIQLASQVADTSESKSLVDEASQAYLNCQYDTAYDLSQNAMKASSTINISAETAIIAVATISILSLGYYFKKHPKKLKNIFKKSKRKK